jgi:hypothetical protein
VSSREQGADSPGVQAALFEAGLPLSAAQERTRRGRGAVPVERYLVTLPEPNPAGRRTVTIEYRPLIAWTEQRLATVRELLVLYFACIGAFRRAGTATVRAWHDALNNGMFTADELRLGIGAKAHSLEGTSPDETRSRRRFAAHPVRFLRVAGYWLSQSPEYQARQQVRRATDGQRLRLRLAAVAVGRVRGSGSEPLSAAGIGEPDRVAAERAVEARQSALWEALAPAQRAVALAAIGPAFRSRCQGWGVRPDDPKLCPVWLATAVSWALAKWPDASRPTSYLRAVLP